MGCPIIIGDWQIAPPVAESLEAARQADYESAMAAIARGRAALARPLPSPRCERTSWLRAAVREMAELGVLHYADTPAMHTAHPGLKGIIRLEKLRAASRDQRAFQAQNAGFESPAALHQ